MPTFFRKIRKQLAGDNKPKKYLRYAIGEILLVVIGILVALQINNWNEKRIQLQNINNSLAEIHSNLTVDYKLLNFLIEDSDRLINKISQLELNGENMPMDSLIKKITEIHRVMGWRPITTGYNKLHQLKGNVNLQSELLKKLTNSYHYFESPLSNHGSKDLSVYSVNKYRDYLIKNAFPLISPMLKNEIKNKTAVREFMKDPEFIGILRNFQYNLAINSRGFKKALTIVANMIANLEAYFENEKIIYKKLKK